MRFVLLDLFRFAAVALVVLAHFFQFQGNPLGNTMDFFGQRATIGGIGVSIFIVLSGLSLQLSKKGLPFKEFFKKRLLRIYPVYWVALFFAMAISFFLLNPFSLVDLACGITGFCAFIGRWGGVLPVAWFIGTIISLYALFPFISKVLQKKPVVCLVLLFCIALASKIVVSQFVFVGPRALDWFPLSRIFEFGFGIFLAIKLPQNAWCKLDWLPFAKIINFLGLHSFEIFLFHYPLLELFFAFLNK